MTEDSPALDPAPAIGRAPGDQETPRPDPLAHPADRDPAEAAQLALVTGASGYVGRQLIPALLAAGWRVRVLTRRRSGVAAHPWAHLVEVFEGDAADPVAVGAALAGADVAYYLIHSMGDAADYAARDRELAHTFATAARAARRSPDRLPERTAPGRRDALPAPGLTGGGRADPSGFGRADRGAPGRGRPGQRIGLVRHAALLRRAPAGDGRPEVAEQPHPADRRRRRPAARWSARPACPTDVNRTFDIGGPEVMTYRRDAPAVRAVTGLRRRLIVTLPVLTPGLASHWVGLVTPIESGLAKPLVGSLVHDVVCREHDISGTCPDPPAA